MGRCYLKCSRGRSWLSGYVVKTLRPDQERALVMLRKAVAAGKRRIVLNLPCGWGKTILASKIVEGGLRKGTRSCFTAPAITLIDQTIEKFNAEGITEIGVIQANHMMTDWDMPVQIASPQTLARRKSFPEAQIVIVDECNQQFEIIRKWMAHPDHYNTLFIGLDAAPGGKGMGAYWEDLIVPTTYADLIRDGVLCDFEVYGPKIAPDLKGVPRRHGDLAEAELSGRMQAPPLIADAVETWLEKAKNRPTFNFAVDRAHAKKLQQAFEAKGIPTGYMDAYTERADRAKIFGEWRTGLRKVIFNVLVCGVGVDEDVQCLQICRPTESRDLHVQIDGRGLRNPSGIKPNMPGAKKLLILDHTQNHTTHGFVTDIFYSHLDTSVKGEKQKTEQVTPAKLPKQCPKCGFLKPAGVPICPQCSFKPERISKTEHAEGELISLTAKKKGPTPEEKRDYHAQLLWLQIKREKKDGWANGLYKSKFGEWPNGKPNPKEASQEVKNYVTSRGIAFGYKQKKMKAQANG